MGKNLVGTLLVLAFIFLASGQGKAQTVTGQTAGTDTEEINGYPASDYYYKTITIPPDIEKSEKKEDQINVAIHYKIVSYEQEALRPLKSLEKNEMEAMLARFHKEAEEELGYAQPPAPPAEEPKEKPAVIYGDD